MQNQKNPVPSVAQNISPPDVVTDNSNSVDDGGQSVVQEMADAPHPDMFDGGDRSIVLGTDEWVTLGDGRQSKVTYSVDGQLLTVDGSEFEMFSATFVSIPLKGKVRVPSRITVGAVTIQGKTLIIKGSSKGLSGETVLSEQELRDFVDALSKGGTPNFPLKSLIAESGFIVKHEKPEEPE